MATLTTTREQARADIGILPVVLAALTGVFLIYFTGFSEASVFHDAAHDTRHTLAFPCH